MLFWTWDREQGLQEDDIGQTGENHGAAEKWSAMPIVKDVARILGVDSGTVPLLLSRKETSLWH